MSHDYCPANIFHAIRRESIDLWTEMAFWPNHVSLSSVRIGGQPQCGPREDPLAVLLEVIIALFPSQCSHPSFASSFLSFKFQLLSSAMCIKACEQTYCIEVSREYRN